MCLSLLTDSKLYERGENRYKCSVCNIDIDDKANYVLFMYIMVRNMRGTEWERVTDVMPPSLGRDINIIRVMEKTHSLVTVWMTQMGHHDLYIGILKFVWILGNWQQEIFLCMIHDQLCPCVSEHM